MDLKQYLWRIDSNTFKKVKEAAEKEEVSINKYINAAIKIKLLKKWQQ